MKRNLVGIKIVSIILILAWLGVDALFFSGWIHALKAATSVIDESFMAFLGYDVLLWVALAWIVGIGYSVVDKIVCPNYGRASGEAGNTHRVNFFKMFTMMHSVGDFLFMLVIMLFYPLILIYLTFFMIGMLFIAIFKTPCPKDHEASNMLHKYVFSLPLEHVYVNANVHTNKKKAIVLITIKAEKGYRVDGKFCKDLSSDLADVANDILNELGGYPNYKSIGWNYSAY